MLKFVSEIPKEKTETKISSPIQTTDINMPPPLNSSQKKAIDDFLSALSFSKDSLNFSIESLMELSSWSTEEAINFYLSNMDSIQGMCPPKTPPRSSNAVVTIPSGNGINLSCGHVEANLGVETLQQLADTVDFIQLGALPPAYIDGEYGEYTNNQFTLMIPMKHITK